MSDVAKSESSTEQYWKDYLQWGGIVATTWQTSFKALKDGLDSGMIPLENLHTEAAKAFGRNYQFLSEKVIEWAAHVDSARGPLATAFAEKQRVQYIAEAAALTDDAVGAFTRLSEASARNAEKLKLFLPAVATHVGSAFDWLQVIDAIRSGDLSGIYGNLAQMVAAESAVAMTLGLATISGIGVATVPAALVVGIIAGLVAWLGSDDGFGFYSKFGRWIEPYAAMIGRDYAELLPKGAWDSVFSIAEATTTHFRAAFTLPKCDPLAIDLDSDGIETVGIGGSPVLFDHDGDGLRSGTGWLAGDDGWLVRDLNGNGQIDSGRELFGADTQIIVDGVARNASSGFEALAALDANADGVFDAADAAFAELRIWRDLNQDGLSQGGELGTLAANGITGIELTPTGDSAELGNGNSVSGRATVHRAGGEDRVIEAVALADAQAAQLHVLVQARAEASTWPAQRSRPRGVPKNAFGPRAWRRTATRGHATSGARP